MTPTPSRTNARLASKPVTRTLVENLRWGSIAGLFFACVYSLYVLGLYLLRGTAAFDANHTTLGKVLISYFGGGVAAGVLVGLLRPLLRWRLGAVVVGIIATFTVFVGIALVDQGGFSHWDGDTWLNCAVLGMLFGPIVALVRWNRSRE